MIELIKKHNIKSVESKYDEFKRLYNRLIELSRTKVMNYQEFPKIAVPPINQPLSANTPSNNNKQKLISLLRPIHGTEIKVDLKYKKSAPITQEAINFIKKYAGGSRVLEIGCGSGIYAKILRDNGVDVIASDACRINKEGLPNSKTRMAYFTNEKAISNIICKNAVTAVKNHGQNSNLSLFLSFPLPHDYNSNSNISYDKAALHNFKGNKFFLIANYQGPLNSKNYKNSISDDSTGSHGFHEYLTEKWNMIDYLLLSSGGFLNLYCYLIYFERKQ